MRAQDERNYGYSAGTRGEHWKDGRRMLRQVEVIQDRGPLLLVRALHGPLRGHRYEIKRREFK